MAERKIEDILQASMWLEVKHGQPPEEALSMAIEHLLVILARRIRDKGRGDDVWFPLCFPMRMTLTGETKHWDFLIKLKLENDFSLSAKDRTEVELREGTSLGDFIDEVVHAKNNLAVLGDGESGWIGQEACVVMAHHTLRDALASFVDN